MEAIEFVSRYPTYIEQLENVVKPECQAAIAKLKDIDPIVIPPPNITGCLTNGPRYTIPLTPTGGPPVFDATGDNLYPPTASSYSYLWSDPGNSTTATLGPVSVGTYNVTVSTGGCSVTASYNLLDCSGKTGPPSSGNNIKDSVPVATAAPSFMLYPNPTNSTVTIELIGKVDNYDLAVYDLLGQQILHQTVQWPTNNTITLDLSNNSDGVYFVKMTINGVLKNR